MKKINLETFAGGAASAMFSREMAKILANVHDPNTDPKKARTLTLTVKLVPDEDRRMVKAEISAKSTLVPADAARATLITGKDLQTGQVDMTELPSAGDHLPGQMVMDDQGRAVDPETGEIGEPAPQAPKNIRDLRRAAQQ